jgi:GAF domain-containing protein
MEERMDGGQGAIADLYGVLFPDTPLTELLQRVTTLAARTVANCTVAGITVVHDGVPQTPVYTDERAPRVDQVQYDTGDGPCLDALRLGDVFRIEDTSTETRWREFCDAAVDEGFRSTLSVPIDVSGNRTEVLGALNLYSEIPDAFDRDTMAATESFAQHSAIVIANAQAYWGARQLSAQLQQAMESRAIIEQAKGILMGAEHISADHAFELLVRASQRENRKLRDIAADIVARTEHPPS